MRNAPRASLTFAAAVLVVALLLATAVPARAGRAPDVTVYKPQHFADAAPANAWDMVTRLPGFVVVDTDEDVRGYAGAQGNVLIDGTRPTSKREGIEDLLKRIPAASVQRIEVIHSGTPGIDMGGYAMLANVVRRSDATTETVVEGGLVASTDGWLSPSGRLQYGRRHDDRVLDLALKFDPELDDDSGRGTLSTRDADGTGGRSRLDTRTIKDKAEASASWRQPLAGGQLTLTGAARGENARTDTAITAITPDADSETVHEDEDSREAEVGVRYLRPFADRSVLELMATKHLGWLDDLERSREDGDDETFDEKTRTGETIARADFTHEWSDTLSLAASLEGALNFLHSDARLQQDGQVVPLPGSDVRIEERRTEAAAGATWKPHAGLALEAGLRMERSTITQTGDTPLTRHFTYPKPRVALRWDIDPRDQLRLALSREVGQLDFGDFVASASLDAGTVSAGNAELQPDRTWRFSAAWERQLWTDAAVTVTWTHDRISDVVDRILVVADDDIFDAPGNIGDGRRDTLALDLTLPLDGIGFTGGRLRSSMQWHRSRVTDPVTGTARPISEEKPVEGDITLTQDLPALRLTWGVLLEHIAERETKYRFDEIKRESEGMGWTLFVERRLGDHWRVRAEATDLFGRGFVETREKYDGPRSRGVSDGSERRDRTTPGFVGLTFRRSTGG